MNEKEIGELRRRLKPEKTSITHIFGCYVNEKQEIASTFDQPLGVLSEEEGERLLALLRRALSGSVGKNLMDMEFTTQQVADSEEHRRLTALREAEDPETLRQFYETVAGALQLDTGYLILLARDAYDVPHKGKDDLTLAEGSETVFRYVLCAICPVKLGKTALTYAVTAGEFHNRATDWLVGSPELGFLFPAFDNRATNLYAALYYCKSGADNHEDFVQAVFHRPAPMPAAEQRENFQTILGDSLGDECSLETVQTVRDQLCAMIQEHKESKEPELLTITRGTVKGVLAACGISEPKVEAFGQQYGETFGEDTDLPPKNLIDPRQMEVTTPDVTIRVNPERPELIQTKVLGGAKYILIRADEGVQVNGVNIQIHD
ncbi:MAG TPA: DUF4317 domain-containing protein [Candidatus Faecousia faecigallinarum]|nr:DUF4317 domain-containing protein [Candidatus Faecousia faecigallinarum]